MLADVFFIFLILFSGRIITPKVFSNPGLILPIHFFIGFYFLTLLVVTSLWLGIEVNILSLGVIGVFYFFCIKSLAFFDPDQTNRRDDFTLWYLSILIITVLFSYFNFTVFSWDSYFFNAYGVSIASQGKVVGYTGTGLASYPIMAVMPHIYSELLGVDYFAALTPISSCFILLFLFSSLLKDNENVWFSLLAPLFILSTYFYIFSSFYIHSNLYCAGFLLIAAVCLKESIAEMSINLLILAAILLSAVCLLRIEGGLVVALFLAIIGSNSRFVVENINKIFFIMLPVLLWNGFLILVIGKGSQIGSPMRLAMVSVILVSSVGFLYLISKLPSKLKSFMDLKVFFLVLLVGGALFFLKWNHLNLSFWNSEKNLLERGYWGAAWWMILGLFPFFFFLRKGERLRKISVFLLVYMVLILALSTFRKPYRLGWGDSGNRLMLQIFPLMVFYIWEVACQSLKLDKWSLKKVFNKGLD